MKAPRSRLGNEGFTFVELMIAFSILTIVLVAWMMVALQSFALTNVSDNRVVAVKEAQIVLNNISAAVGNPGAFPANVVAAFPAGAVNPPRTTLPFQVTSITYANPNANPLFVTVQIQYQEDSGRVWTERLSSALTDI